MDRPDPQQLAQAIKTMSDAELEKQIAQLGPHEVLAAIFDEMPNYFVAERAAGIDATVQYDIATPDGTEAWTVVYQQGTCKTEEGPAGDPRLTLQLALTDFVKLVFGQAQGPQLFMTGRLKLKGDMMFAMQMQTFFKPPSA